MRIRHGVAIAACTCLVLAATSTASTSSAAEVDPAPTVLSIGENNWVTLNGNTGYGAQAFANRLGGAGFGTSVYTNGRPTADVFNELPTYSVVFLHGHGAPGQIETNDSADPENALLAKIDPTIYWDVLPAPDIREVDDYLPESELDDNLLTIFSACNTADTSDVWGNLLDVAVSKGVDSVLGMRGQPLIPDADNPTPNSFGNYFWNRAGLYLQSGDTLSQSLNKALQDLIAKEGSGSGWGSYVIDGATASPGSTRVSPPRPGTTRIPGIGLIPSRPNELSPNYPAQAMTVDGTRVLDAVTADGISFRTDAATGQLLAVSGEALPSGETVLTHEEAVEVARRFAVGQLGAGGQITDLSATRDGVLANSVVSTVTIEARDSRDVANLLLIEVDRRSGRITTYVRGHGSSPVATQTSVTSDQAVGIAQQSAPGADLLGVELRHWSTPEWVVRLDDPAHDGTPALLREVHVSAQSGDITSRAVADNGDEVAAP
jgi:hypothetical protein